MLTLEPLSMQAPLRRDTNGTYRIGETRVTLETVIGAYLDGETPEQIVASYDVLSLADVYAIITYYWRNQDAVQAYLKKATENSQKAHREIGQRSGRQLRTLILERQRTSRSEDVPFPRG